MKRRLRFIVVSQGKFSAERNYYQRLLSNNPEGEAVKPGKKTEPPLARRAVFVL